MTPFCRFYAHPARRAWLAVPWLERDRVAIPAGWVQVDAPPAGYTWTDYRIECGGVRSI